jgi:CBS domain-containing protein
MIIEELNLKTPIVIDPMATSDEAIELMWHHDIRHLLVADHDGFVGLVTDAELLESVGMLLKSERLVLQMPHLNEEVLVADIMETEIPCATPDMLVTDVAHQMLYGKRTAMPVIRGSKPVGIVTETDMLSQFAGTCWLQQSSLHQEPALNFGSRVLKTIPPDATLTDACEILSTRRLRHLPIVEDGRICGLLSDWDVRSAIGRNPSSLTWMDQKVETAMQINIQTLGRRSTMSEAAQMMYQEKLTALPVIEADKTLLGLLTVSDVLRAFCTGSIINC